MEGWSVAQLRQAAAASASSEPALVGIARSSVRQLNADTLDAAIDYMARLDSMGSGAVMRLKTRLETIADMAGELATRVNGQGGAS